MQEINLLQTKIKDRNLAWEKRNRLINTLAILVIVLEVLLTGGLYYMKNAVQKNISQIEAENTAARSRISDRQKDLAPAISFQAQLKNLRTLVDNHVYWSGLLDELTKSTYNRTQYRTLQAQTSGLIHIEGVVPSYSDLSKFILGLYTSDKFTSIKLLSVQPSDQAQGGYLFSLDMQANPNLLKK